MSSGRAQGGDDRLIHVATDGESYGHHTKWGDRALAYALHREAKAQDYLITNYGEYLDRQPPKWEAELKLGPNGEGTAWSCAHGVGRWIRDCGCSTGAQEGWNQAWRAPLREALDILRDGLVPEFEREAGLLLHDPWAARDAFIDVVLDPSDSQPPLFPGGPGPASLGPAEEQVRALSLLDLQRQCMLMYTSCGWFFTEISGIETIQILKYACRLMDDLAELGFVRPAPRIPGKLARGQEQPA